MTNSIALLIPTLLSFLAVSLTSPTPAAEFLFGIDSGGQNGLLVGQTTSSLERGGFTSTLTALPSGALLDDRDDQGLGINTNPLSDVTDGGPTASATKFNIIQGANPLSGNAESLSFSFDRPGVLKTLLFDGMKDETLEYFTLGFPDGTIITLFDSQTEYRLGLQGFALSDLEVPNPVEAQTEQDDLEDIDYPFQAGDVFTITYDEGDYAKVPGYRTHPSAPSQFPNTVGDGARFQGIVVSVPEPQSITLAGLIMSAACLLRSKHPQSN